MNLEKCALAAFSSLALFAAAADARAQTAAKPPTVFIEGDIVLGQVCVTRNQFKHNEPVVWRMRVRDGKTGADLDASALKSLVIQIGDGQKLTMKFSGHPRGGTDDHFWSVSWKVPENYPTGTLLYKVVATGAAGDVTEWEPFKIKTSQLTIVQ